MIYAICALLFTFPLPIVLVVLPPFPLFVAIALLHQRRADALDVAFRKLVTPEE